ncbi:conserved unknown protein [Ectocarpus siliculosus]|uniref:FAM194 C-terminal domain-containing protein n=1 Tax=Ectocarpus siliculosus TaxID=2880 RepID=D7FM51_ECTSI|nr:conserved unknown protein [Ectocarpus siliculosus]|eukprot:CBJ29876.1 conserved unknown protein [Ectocarpus siliculosus]
MSPQGGVGTKADNAEYYPSGRLASVFKEDGSGFIYYPSGLVAVCKGVVDGRGRYYVYGDDRRSTPLGAVNEHGVGFFLGPSGVRLALSKVGGLITDRHGYIAREWRYDPGAHMPPPTSVLDVKLNKSMNFEFLDRREMRIKFLHEGISHELDAGVHPKREGTYLDNRQQAFGNAMKAKRDRLKPRSRNLAGACKSLVASLENGFDGMNPQVEPFPDPSWKHDALTATYGELPRIRSTGLEVGPTHGLGSMIYDDDDDGRGGPGMRRSRSWGGGAGVGSGGEGGRGDDAFAAASRLRKGGKWLGELDVRLQVSAENPLLKRLRAFLEEEAAPDQLVTVLGVRGDDPACNKVQTIAELANCFLVQGLSSSSGEGGSEGGEGGEGGRMNNNSRSSSAAGPSSRASVSGAEKYRMVRVDFAEHRATAELYGVQALPAFLMFQGGRLAWVGTLGGSPLKAAPPAGAAGGRRVLLVEPCAKRQISTERALRRFGCSWDLVLNAPQALLRIQVARTNSMASDSGNAASPNGEGYGVLMISNALGAAEVIALEKALHGGGAGFSGGGADSVVVGLAHVQGDPSAMGSAALRVVSAGFTEAADGKRAVLSPHLALVADVAVSTPVRTSALEAVFDRCCNRPKEDASVAGVGGKRGDGKGGVSLSMSASCSALEGGDGRYKGVTPSRLLQKMEEVGAQLAMGIFASNQATKAGRQHRPGRGGAAASAGKGGILLSAQETSCKGFLLERSTLQRIAL